MAQEKPSSHEQEIQQAGKKVVDVAEQVREITQDKELKDRLYPLVEKLDQSTALEKFRTFWDKVPYAMQWAIVYMPQSIPNIPGETVKLLIKLGLIEYKGGTSEDDIKSRNEWELRKNEWAIKIGALFIPELKPVIPLLEPIRKVESIKQEIFTDIRFHVREQRQKRADRAEANKIREQLGIAA